MTRLLRIVCDNPGCSAQVERFASDWIEHYRGMDDTPEGWFRLDYHQPVKSEATISLAQPMFFCSPACVRAFSGESKTPTTV